MKSGPQNDGLACNHDDPPKVVDDIAGVVVIQRVELYRVSSAIDDDGDGRYQETPSSTIHSIS